MPQAVIVDCLRTPVGMAPTGTLRNTRPDDLAAVLIRTLTDKYPQVPRDEIDDVILGCATPEAETGMNMARLASLRAGLPDVVPGVTVNRLCASGLQAIVMAADRIRAGEARIIIAGGSESMSMLPATGARFSPNPRLVEDSPEIYMTMGLAAENLRRKFDVNREDQDAFAFRSHQKALKAQAGGNFDEEIVPVTVETTTLVNGKPEKKQTVFARDEGPCAGTSLEKLAGLRPVFHASGAITAGNSAPAGDGAAAALVMSANKAGDLGLKPMARLVSFAVSGVPPEIMGVGPVVAVPKALALGGLELGDIGLIELNEAFAVQALVVIRRLGLDIDRVNVNGGAVALGHPLGCAGARLTATILHEMRRRKVRYGMVAMCVGGGQGAAGVFELI